MLIGCDLPRVICVSFSKPQHFWLFIFLMGYIYAARRPQPVCTCFVICIFESVYAAFCKYLLSSLEYSGCVSMIPLLRQNQVQVISAHTTMIWSSMASFWTC